TDDPAVWVAPFLDEMVAIGVRKELAEKYPEQDVNDPQVWEPAFIEVMKQLERPVSMKLTTINNINSKS
ncbi:hypothetical protein ACJAN2_004328, partial [Escherichia coli]